MKTVLICNNFNIIIIFRSISLNLMSSSPAAASALVQTASIYPSPPSSRPPQLCSCAWCPGRDDTFSGSGSPADCPPPSSKPSPPTWSPHPGRKVSPGSIWMSWGRARQSGAPTQLLQDGQSAKIFSLAYWNWKKCGNLGFYLKLQFKSLCSFILGPSRFARTPPALFVMIWFGRFNNLLIYF